MTVAHELLRKLYAAFKANKFAELKEISGDAAREAFVYEDRELVDISLIAYALYKLAQKRYITQSPTWGVFRKETLQKLEECAEDGETAKIAHGVMEKIHSLSQKFGRFAQSAVEKGRLKAAAQMYAHGASLTKAAELTEAPLSEVASYIGSTKIAEKYQTEPVAERLKKTRELFR